MGSRKTPKSDCGEGEETDHEESGNEENLEAYFDLPEDAPVERMVHYIRGLQLCANPGVHFFGSGDLSDEEVHEVAQHVFDEENEDDYIVMPPLIPIEDFEDVQVGFVKGVVEARDPSMEHGVETRRAQVIKDFEGSVFLSKLPDELPPVRGPFGEAEINLNPGAKPVKQRMFHITGERREAWDKLTDEVIASGKVEPGQSPWNSPSFPVPKKNPGEYRLVEDFRQVNANTEDDAHPLPRIDEMVQRQSEFQMWSSFDCKYGYHQMPLKKRIGTLLACLPLR